MVSIVEDESIVWQDAYTVSSGPVPLDRGAFFQDDLDAMPNDGRRYEIIDGTLIVSAAPGRLHQRAVGRIFRLLDDACPPELEVLVAPFSVALSVNTVIQPDVLAASRSRLTDKDLHGVPELAVEVLSPSTRLIDLHVKLERLDRAGCPSFWVVDPCARAAEASLTVWQLSAAKRYVVVAEVTGEQEFHATLPYPVTVVPAALVR
jgi:Uma2 family endonuclease